MASRMCSLVIGLDFGIAFHLEKRSTPAARCIHGARAWNHPVLALKRVIRMTSASSGEQDLTTLGFACMSSAVSTTTRTQLSQRLIAHLRLVTHCMLTFWDLPRSGGPNRD